MFYVTARMYSFAINLYYKIYKRSNIVTKNNTVSQAYSTTMSLYKHRNT